MKTNKKTIRELGMVFNMRLPTCSSGPAVCLWGGPTRLRHRSPELRSPTYRALLGGIASFERQSDLAA